MTERRQPDAMPVDIRMATEADAEALAALVNRAYEAERFFVLGDRTNAEDVRAEMQQGTFLVAMATDGRLVGSVHVTTAREPASFGMLAVDPADQGRGIGRRLVDAAESRARAAGRRSMVIHVVNLRTDLLALYGRLGYVAVGQAAYVHRATIQPCHFIVMTRDL